MAASSVKQEVALSPFMAWSKPTLNQGPTMNNWGGAATTSWQEEVVELLFKSEYEFKHWTADVSKQNPNSYKPKGRTSQPHKYGKCLHTVFPTYYAIMMKNTKKAWLQAGKSCHLTVQETNNILTPLYFPNLNSTFFLSSRAAYLPPFTLLIMS